MSALSGAPTPTPSHAAIRAIASRFEGEVNEKTALQSLRIMAEYTAGWQHVDTHSIVIKSVSILSTLHGEVVPNYPVLTV